MLIFFLIMSVIAKIVFIFKYPVIAMLLWLVADTGFLVHNLLIGEFTQSALFLFYSLSNIVGIYIWRK